MGAWIETDLDNTHYKSIDTSHPVWVRGLKQLYQDVKALRLMVAPRVGAWIETISVWQG